MGVFNFLKKKVEPGKWVQNTREVNTDGYGRQTLSLDTFSWVGPEPANGVRPPNPGTTPEALAKKVVSAKRAWADGLYDNRKKANWVPTDEQREKMREARAKQTPPSLGKTHSPETKAKMAEARRLYWATHHKD